MRCIKSLILTSTLVSTLTFIARAEINVLASVKPLHSLVAGVMEGVKKPDLIVKGAASPHTYSLKPSQAKQLEEADLIFWIGHELESFLEKPLEAIAKKATVVELIDSNGLKKLEMREGGAFDEHGHKEHEEHSEDKHDKHADESHDEHHQGEFDIHVWLDPENAKVLVNEIKEALIEIDPGNIRKYEANAKNLMTKLNQLVAQVTAKLATSKGKGFVVFHDAYQYFEERFGMKAVGSITVSPEVVPGASRIRDLKEKINELNALCVFSEPQFQPKIVFSVVEGTKANTGVLDPLGASIKNGSELYFTLIRDMANSLKECLSKKG